MNLHAHCVFYDCSMSVFFDMLVKNQGLDKRAQAAMLSQVACEDSEELRALCRFAIFLEVLLKPCVVEDAIEGLGF